MIARLRGRIVARGGDHVILDVDGVGYLVHVPAPGDLPPGGGEVVLHTSLQVRDDALTLYGFPDTHARDLFQALLGASGVGPRLALAALSTHGPERLRRAIADGDVEALQLVKGIGRKVAQRLVLELRGELALEEPAGDGVVADVREALLGLGYTAGEAREATSDLDPDGDEQTLLRRALRCLHDGEGVGR